MRRGIVVAIAAIMVAASSAEAGTPGFIRGRLICAVNTGRWLQHNGLRSTGSWSSKSYLSFTRVSRSTARFGDVRFNFRKGGGHVQPVLGWRGGTLWCQNPSSRRGWVTKPCPPGGIYVRPGSGGNAHHGKHKRGK